MKLSQAFLAASTIGLLAVSAEAQFDQYTAPGSLAESSVPRKQQIEQAVQDARWSFGSLRVNPWLSLRDVIYTDNLFAGSGGEETSDFTATVGAGLKAYLPVSSKTTLAAYALPEYVWWQDQSDRRQLVGRYGAGLFSYFNRMTVELEGGTSEQQGVVSTEFDQRIPTKRESLRGLVEVEVARSFWVFGEGATDSFRHQVDEFEDTTLEPFDRLDRDEDILRGGVRLQLANGWSFSAGAERSEADFKNATKDLSNSGTSPFVELLYTSDNYQLQAQAVSRDLEPEPGSEFVAFDEVTGLVSFSFEPRRRVSLQLYGYRSLSYSISFGYAYSLEERLGIAGTYRLGRRTSLSAYTETGESDFVTNRLGIPDRLEDIDAVGGRLEIQLRQQLFFNLGASRVQYDSNLPGLDREITRIQSFFRLGKGEWP